MKKNNLSKILVLSLLAFSTLASCGETSQSSVGGPSTIINGIDVYPLDSAVIGEKINLKDYIKVDGDTDDFVAEVTTPTTAVLNAETYELTIIGEGKVSVFITAGEYEQLLEFNAISQSLNTFKEIVEDLDYNFFLGYFNSETGISEDGNVFNERYELRYSEAYGNTPESYEGYIYGDKAARRFTVDNLEGDNFVIQNGEYSSNYYEPSLWQIYYDLFTTQYFSATETYLYGDIEAAEAMCSTLGYNSARNIAKIYEPILLEEGYISEGDTVSMAVTVTFLELPSVNEEGDIVNIVSPQISLFLETSNMGLIDIGINYYLLTDEMSYTLDYVEEAIDNNNIPALVMPTPLLDKVDEICESKNYTLEVRAAWVDVKTGEDATYPEDIDPYFLESWFDYEVSQYVTETAVYSKFDEEKYTKYELESDNKVYFTSNIDDSTGDWETWGTLAEPLREESTYADIWGGTNSSYNRVLNSVANNADANAGINVVGDYYEDDKKDLDYELSSANNGYKYVCALMSLIPFYGPSLANWYSQTIPNYNNASLAELYILSTYVYMTEDEFKVEFLINWDGKVGFSTTMTLKNIGSTVIPA